MIPVSEPLLGEEELKNVIECVKSGWISSAGDFISRFEEDFSKYCGVDYGVAVSNGSVALHTAILSLNLEPNDEVIMPAFTIISCAFAIINGGGKPILVDSDPATYNINVNKIEERITENTKAIMVVHIYGHPVDMDPVLELAKKHNLVIIEDSAEAHGAEYKGKKVGGIGDIGCFSFYANKIITTGEGGMVLTNNKECSEKLKSIRNLCFDSDRRFLHDGMGHNYRMTNLQAGVGVGQMKSIDKFIDIKRKNAKSYNKLLGDTPKITLPIEKKWAKNVYWMYAVVLDESIGDSWSFIQKLKKAGVGARPFFMPMHKQPIFIKMGLFNNESYPIAEKISKQGLYLPSGLTLKEGDIEEICSIVKDILTN